MTKKLLPLLMITSALFATSNDRFHIDLNTDKDGKTTPDVFIPIDWNENLFSGIGFKSFRNQQEDSISGAQESRIYSQSDEDRVRLNILTYENSFSGFKYSIGGEYEYIKIDKSEFGYIHFPDSLGGDWVSTNNEVEITASKPNIATDLTFKNSDKTALFRIGATISPFTSLSIDQETFFKPINSEISKKSTSSTQDLSYSINLESKFKTGTIVDIILKGEYEFLPLAYKINQFNVANNQFQEGTVKTESTNTMYLVKFVINHPMFGETLRPAIGFGSRSETTKDLNSNIETTDDSSIFSLSYEGRF